MTGSESGTDRQREDDVASVPRNKSILLFSDGTGNSSAKLFKTNVWRMYEAIDLGPSSAGKRDQIAYYDNGVGTASFRPLRLIQGAFGYGLKRNVLEIYRYACRNYRPGGGQRPGPNPDKLGDRFYGFGFSRGAFTMRLATDLIAAQGIVRFSNEKELAYRTRQAFRAHCASGPGLGWKALPTQAWRGVRNFLASAWNRITDAPAYDQSDNYQAVVRFVGVWDTVAAYGGPIVEITRAIDTFVYPLSMPSYHLDPRIECARHALSLDDERDSFFPLLWDEVHEKSLVDAGTVPPDRLEQVWFTGMHADVGGGYPDESLSYVSLLWMLNEAEKAGIRTLDVITERYLALANSYGPMHNSRAGLASYYRYQPRKIAALLHPVETTTLSLRDPVIRNVAGPQGLLLGVKVHESVIARVATGTDSYAPIVLPPSFTIVPPGDRSEAQPQPVSDGPPGCRRARPRTVESSVLDPAIRAQLMRPGAIAALGGGMERVWDLVWLRRVTYFATVVATIALLILPLWPDSSSQADEEAKSTMLLQTIENMASSSIPNDGRDWSDNLVMLPTAYLPDFVQPWFVGFARYPLYYFALLLLILALSGMSMRLHGSMRDRGRLLWATALGQRPAQTGPAPSRFQKLRISRAYQRPLQIFKWYLLPTLIGLLILAFFGWIALVVVTQMNLPGLEESEELCRTTGNSAQIQHHQVGFYANRTCNTGGGTVEESRRYVVIFDVLEPWADGSRATTPAGATAWETGAAGLLGAPLRRVITARYLQPLFAVRTDDTGEAGRGVHIYPLDLVPVAGSTSQYRAEFQAPATGELFLFSNEAVLPAWTAFAGFGHDYFYGRAPRGRNSGSACVTIAAATAMAGARPTGMSICAKVRIRNATPGTRAQQRDTATSQAAATKPAPAH